MLTLWCLLNMLLLNLILLVGELTETAEGCFATSYHPLHLTCGSHQRIHVINITYQKTTKDCQPSPVTCKVVQKSRSDAFSTTCNGLQTCLAPVQDFWIIEKCRDVPFFTVSISYECISDNAILDICNTTTATSSNGLIYLASPNYFNPVLLGPSRSCVCKVTGQDMVLEILELYLRLMKGVRASLTLTTKNTTWSPPHHSLVVYNNIMLRGMPVVDIDFNTLRRYGQMMWIRITGSSEINLSCNGGSNDTVYLPVGPSRTVEDGSTSTVVEASSTVLASTITQFVTSTESHHDTETPRIDVLNSTAIVRGVCGGIILILIIAIILLFVCFKELKPSRGEANNTVHVNGEFGNLDTNTSDSPYELVTISTLDTSAPDSDEQRSRDTNNIYSRLSQYENQDGQHEYRKIHVYGNTRV